MKLALFGLGGMGGLVDRRAREAGHEIAAAFDERDADRPWEDLAGALRGCDAAVDFTTAGAVTRHVRAAVAAGVPLVEGTTGWQPSLSTEPIEDTSMRSSTISMPARKAPKS